MEKSRNFFLVIFSVLFQFRLLATTADTTSIIDNIYNYDFLKASEKLAGLYEKDPLISETMNLEIKWWMAIERGDDQHFSEFLTALNRFEKNSGNDISVIISSTYRMRYYACTGKNYMLPFLFLRVESKINKADLISTEATGRNGHELFSLYRSFLSLVRNSIIPDIMLSDSGRKQNLIAEIEKVILNGSSENRTIGRYFMMKYYLDIEKSKSKAYTYISELHGQYPNNLIFSQLLTN
jgi:hypothetical protein